MKKILFVLALLVSCSSYAQTEYITLAYTSELYATGADQYKGIIVLRNDLKPEYTGGIFWYCDTCDSYAADSITYFNRFFGGKWKKTAEIPLSGTPEGKTGQVIYSNGAGLGYMSVASLLPTMIMRSINGMISTKLTTNVGDSIVSNEISTKRVDPFSGTTDASGNYTVTYSSAFSTVPVLSYNIVTNNNLMDWKVTSSTTSGFTINVYTRNTGNVLTNLLGALTGALLTGTTPASGVSINGFSTEK